MPRIKTTDAQNRILRRFCEGDVFDAPKATKDALVRKCLITDDGVLTEQGRDYCVSEGWLDVSTRSMSPLAVFVTRVKRICEEADISVGNWGNGFREQDPTFRASYGYGRKATKTTKDAYLFCEWETGGMSGGSCWDDAESTGYSTGNQPEELVALDKVLEEIKPDLSFLQYKSLLHSVVKTGTREENEYYGNCTNYAYKLCKVEDLFSYFRNKGWIE